MIVDRCLVHLQICSRVCRFRFLLRWTTCELDGETLAKSAILDIFDTRPLSAFRSVFRDIVLARRLEAQRIRCCWPAHISGWWIGTASWISSMPAAKGEQSNGKAKGSFLPSGIGRKRRPCLPQLPIYDISTDTVINPEGPEENESVQKKT